MDNTIFEQYKALIDGEDQLSVLANTSAFVNEHLDNCNWVGFYLRKGNELLLGPFQGKVACYRIQIGKGVCGTAAYTKETQAVKNVHEFPGHIACDSSTNSEIVVPMIVNDEVVGVLDLDSQSFERFGNNEKEFLENIVKILIESAY